MSLGKRIKVIGTYDSKQVMCYKERLIKASCKIYSNFKIDDCEIYLSDFRCL